ncbi:CrcB protein [Halomonas campaniensis]|uniref:Fluoride-specific ion channel FluC n=1 Tax=Halomonas campaniensis TaxID=213554 RepID=A0A7W5PAJ8_9GAMM|nr:CrcB family protein [Halomonas campaniensis]MBB3330803.1 CrcB protein [Halomonas campaniensis]
MIGWRAYAAVGLGSALGTTLRYQLSLALLALPVPLFPWATLAVNILGAWLIAAFAALAAGRAHGRVARWQPFLVAGFCGGFTTFSLFGLETLQLVLLGHPWRAAVYVLVSVALWLAAAWHGHGVGRRVAATG